MVAKLAQGVVKKNHVHVQVEADRLGVQSEVQQPRCLFAMVSSCKVRPSKGSGWVVG